MDFVNAESQLPHHSDWRVWGPYLSEREWGTVREDNSYDGNCWDYFPHEDAVFRAYQSGEDGLLGISDHQGVLCVSVALSNGEDPILKERLFGLSSPEGNHGEDVKELYHYSNATPSHTLMKALYRYPQQPFPYQQLKMENKLRSPMEREFEITDTGVFDNGNYWDIDIVYAKVSPLNIVCRYTIINRANKGDDIYILPQAVFRNTWSECNDTEVPIMTQTGPSEISLEHPDIGKYSMHFLSAANQADSGLQGPEVLFTNNETNTNPRSDDVSPTKDLFHKYVKAISQGHTVRTPTSGTKCAGLYHLKVPPGGTATVRCQLSCDSVNQSDWLSAEGIDHVISQRMEESNDFYRKLIPTSCSAEESNIIKQAFAGLVWNKQFYCYNVKESINRKESLEQFLERNKILEVASKRQKVISAQNTLKSSSISDSSLMETRNKKMSNSNLLHLNSSAQAMDKSSATTSNTSASVIMSESTELPGHSLLKRKSSSHKSEKDVPKLSNRNIEWQSLINHDIISMPDKWEFPWYAVWDLAFHMVPFCRIDPEFSKAQLLLFLSDRYMDQNGRMPAYEFNFSDLNPPVHAWGCWEVYTRSGRSDQMFLKKAFLRLMLNYNWWFNQRRSCTSYLFGGGFLGLDNISVLDRSNHVPTGWHLHQADGTGWMAFYSLIMLKISVELAQFDPVFKDLISRFVGNFFQISMELNKSIEDGGLWDEETGFYYDVLRSDNDEEFKTIRVRSLVGVIPLTACNIIPTHGLSQDVSNLFQTFLKDNHQHVQVHSDHIFFSAVRVSRISRIVSYLSAEEEFLSPYGFRSLSKVYADHPYRIEINQTLYEMSFSPGESTSKMFGGNSNWRGPIYFSVNYLLLETLSTINDSHANIDLTFFKPNFSLGNLVREVRGFLISIFLPGHQGRRPCHGDVKQYSKLPDWEDKVLFFEYFHSETGRGCGARCQTGWTALVIELIMDDHSPIPPDS